MYKFHKENHNETKRISKQNTIRMSQANIKSTNTVSSKAPFQLYSAGLYTFSKNNLLLFILIINKLQPLHKIF